MKLVSIEERNILLMQEKLHEAQMLLSDVYAFACDEGIGEIENQMSVADSCVIDAMQYLEQLEAQAIDDASWRA
jgi:hypothetical protein